MYVLLAIAVLIFAVLLLRIRVFAEYSEEGFSGVLRIAFIRIPFPMRKGKKLYTDNKKKHDEDTGKKRGGNTRDFKKMIKPLLRAMGKLVKTVKIHELCIDIKVASGNAFNTAMMYGGMSAAVGMIYPWIENNLKVVKKSINAEADFEASESTVYCATQLSLAVWQILWLCSGLIYGLLKAQNIKEK